MIAAPLNDGNGADSGQVRTRDRVSGGDEVEFTRRWFTTGYKR